MTYGEFIYLADLAGVAVFATTGALAAQGKRLDIFGVVILGIVTALGGGSLRDIALDAHPLVWIADPLYLWVAILSSVLAFILCRYIQYPRRMLLLLDALGLSLFAVLGAQKAMAFGMPDTIAVMMGVVTGVAGGMIRDLLTGQVPLILQWNGEMYATCALVGAGVFVFFSQVMAEPAYWLDLSAMTIVLVFRMAALVAKLRLPEFIVAGHKLESPEEARNLEKKDP
ncbi:membrane protein [Marinobacterium nitratireducens]|uniref:Membrane protein n=1 Tax=Marinobacterium nitratireducens TaxID=518897 RepID=A0A917ZDA7_9GAMM|nr:trimeric intracellular cation channel family protein [Marinobacterium nitratireducens]GGO80701.1 membrane protein [Marinobacterium nitratireducens]